MKDLKELLDWSERPVKSMLVSHGDLKEFIINHYPDLVYRTEYSGHSIYIQILVLDDYNLDIANDVVGEVKEKLPLGIDFKAELTKDKDYFDDIDMPF